MNGGECIVVSLEEVKVYLKIDNDEEDTLIANFISASEELCEGVLRYPLSEFEIMPEVIKQAILFSVASMYEQREDFNSKSLIDTMTRLLFLFRRECW